MIRRVGPYSTLITPQAGSLFHAVFQFNLRKLLIHGARAALPSLSKSATPLGTWLRGLLARAHTNVAVVALANKLARVAWAVLRSRQIFEMKTAG